jgi:hypothetical protein
MIKIEKSQVVGWEHAIRGMRNPKNSWEKSDTTHCTDQECCQECPMHGTDDYVTTCNLPGDGDTPIIGPNDHNLMMSLAGAGPVHGKFRRMIIVYVDITAPLYWWKEFDTYKVGTVANSCSTMHKIHAKEFELDDFSCEKLTDRSLRMLTNCVITELNYNRHLFVNGCHGVIEPGNKIYWENMIQLLPTSYNQKRTVMLSYEVLANIYQYRKNHKLDEWRILCEWIEELPYSEIIIGEKKE